MDFVQPDGIRKSIAFQSVYHRNSFLDMLFKKDQKVIKISEKIFRKPYEQLNEQEKKLAERLAERTPISREKQWAELISIQQEQLRLPKQFGEEPRKTNEPRPDKLPRRARGFSYPDDFGR